jgi:hypothetical protein
MKLQRSIGNFVQHIKGYTLSIFVLLKKLVLIVQYNVSKYEGTDVSWQIAIRNVHVIVLKV